jgi:hypothetical protein
LSCTHFTSVLSMKRGEEPRKIFIGKFHRISYRTEIWFNINNVKKL